MTPFGLIMMKKYSAVALQREQQDHTQYTAGDDLTDGDCDERKPYRNDTVSIFQQGRNDDRIGKDGTHRSQPLVLSAKSPGSQRTKQSCQGAEDHIG